MEIQQSLKLTIHKKWPSSPKKTSKDSEPINTTATPRLKWKKIFFHTKTKPKIQTPPDEFLCPVSRSLMFDPVIVSSGHSFERSSVEACKNLNFTPQLPDGTTPDFSTLIPNLALKSAILKWCHTTHTPPPLPHNNLVQQTSISPDTKLVQHTSISPDTPNSNLVQTSISPNVGTVEEKLSDRDPILDSLDENPPSNNLRRHAETEVPIRPTHLYTSSEESIATSSASTPPFQLATRPSCCYYSSPSSSEIEPAATPEEEEITGKLKSPLQNIVEEALLSLRKLTRVREETRVQLCTPRILSALRSLVLSKHVNVQVNALASLVNLSLEKSNKVKIVRSGMVPPLIEVLKFGSPEAQEHCAGALFSLSLEDDNKTAIGVLGGLGPLLQMLRVESERTRHDSALALYHLSLVQSNRSKMVKLGSVPVLLSMVKLGHMTGRVLLILGNLGSGSDGRAAMLDAGVVECLVGLLNVPDSAAGSTRESCVTVMYALSHGGLRFKAVAKAAGLVEVLQKVEKVGSERARHKVRKILEMMRAKEVEEEDVDWEELLDSGLGCRTRGRLGGGLDESSANSAEF
ncbi:U-box domain-containing protein 40 [Vigna umbellata]|uniref:U-box domain-containing protein 40 n=1 Tax=Vigna umbellata TaxID=87088 RepID=UPI001F5F86B3|nr:U-box domain-containing protein 40 [Vigna umbellata]